MNGNRKLDERTFDFALATIEASIASKEARETDYWLRLLEKAWFFVDYPKKDEVMSENAAIINILAKIVKTPQSSMADRF